MERERRLPSYELVDVLLLFPHQPARGKHVFLIEDPLYVHVEKIFADNPGSTATFSYPVTYADARRWLQEFVSTRLPRFGDYQDVVSTHDSALFHLVLTPREVLDAALGAENIPLSSLAGFVRQIIRWREFVRAACISKAGVSARDFWKQEFRQHLLRADRFLQSW